MIEKVNKEIVSFLFKGDLPNKKAAPIREAQRPKPKERLNLSKEEVLNSDEMAAKNRAIAANAGITDPK